MNKTNDNLLSMDKIYTFLENKTINYLSKKKEIKRIAKSQKKTFKSETLSWLDAIIFAVVTVILINQFLFQLFVIPTPSMENTILVGNRVIVNKTSYGIEPWPGGNKLFDKERRVQRDDLISFYNPEYDSKGPFFDILSQALFYSTFSLVNIDRNEDGSIAERLYVKRANGFSNDNIKFINGDQYIKPSGYNKFINEIEFKTINELDLDFKRSIDKDYYTGLNAYATLYALEQNGITKAPNYIYNDYKNMKDQNLRDMYSFQTFLTNAESKINPHDLDNRDEYNKYLNGHYIPKNYVLPLGDNRDNSLDGRYFGPVKEADINGKIIATFWPLSEIRIF